MTAAPLSPDARVVVAGGGLAAVAVVRTLREAGWRGALALIGEEPHAPYDRPPLSKAALAGSGPPAPATILSRAEAADLGVELRTGRAVVAIDRAARRVTTADGTSTPYDRLVLATGARPRRLPAFDTVADRTVTLRRIEDAARIRRHLVPGARILIVGAGLIGLETAAAAVLAGCTPMVIEAADRPLARVAPAAVAERLARRHAREGTDLRTATRILRAEPAGDGIAVAFADGSRARFDLAILAVGVEPCDGLARAAGLAVDDGVLVSADGTTSDPAVAAAGDCARFRAGTAAEGSVRFECWRAALDGGAAVARGLVGLDPVPQAPPWFWSDQFDLSLQGVGDPARAARTSDRATDDALLVFGLDAEGRLVSATGVGPPRAIGRAVRAAGLMIAAGSAPAPEDLADPATDPMAIARRG